MNCPFITIRPPNGRPRGGGGNMITTANTLTIRRTAALGDALCATVVADRLISLGFAVNYQTHPACQCLIKRHPLIAQVSDPTGFVDVDLDGAYEQDPGRRNKHFHQMFFERAQAHLGRFGINLGPALNCKPRIFLPEVDKIATRKTFEQFERPWVMVCPRSDTYNVRQVPDGVWHSAAPKMPGTKFWLGRHPAPKGFVDLKAQHFDNVMRWIAVADLVVSVDTGPLHVAAALGRPILAINQSSSPDLHLSDQVDFLSISPAGLDCLNCQQTLCPKNNHMPPCQNVDPDLIAAWTWARWRMESTEDVSAIVAVYQPDVGTLNRCLECLIPQVQEIIVTAEGNSRVPAEATRGGKIRYVQTPQRGIGYGRNTNFGARHSNGKYLLLINDDVFLNQGAVSKMMEVIKTHEHTGIVSSLLRYPDGTIYHSGKVRGPGQRGWGHGNHRQMHSYFSDVTEQENTCGACILVPRKAFYDINGFDEEFFLFAEDDDFCLRMRRAGYKIYYTPHAEGIHMEHQSVNKIGDIVGTLQRANSTFDRKWHAYFDHNLDRVPGSFDY